VAGGFAPLFACDAVVGAMGQGHEEKAYLERMVGQAGERDLDPEIVDDVIGRYFDRKLIDHLREAVDPNRMDCVFCRTDLP